MNDWPFKDPPNLGIFTLKRIVNGGKPILYVSHDEDGDWQFLDDGSLSEEDAAMVSLKTIVELDPSVKGLADLPQGWEAERASPNDPWVRAESE